MIENKYLFHNNETDYLLQDMPKDIVPVQWGWTEEIEKNRQEILSNLGISIASLPCLVVWIPEHYADISFFADRGYTDDERMNIKEHFVSAAWVQFNLLNIEKPWTWQKIYDTINSYHKIVE